MAYSYSYMSLRHAARSIGRRKALGGVVSVKIDRPYEGWRTHAVIKVSIKPSASQTFLFWKDAHMPFHGNDAWVFNIIPAYHPCRDASRTQAYLINGDTERLIVPGESIDIYPPREAQRPSPYSYGNTSRGDWSYVVHPIVAEGRSFTLGMSVDTILTREGADRVVGVIAAALSGSKEYISVSGGFNAPEDYPYPQRRRVLYPSELLRLVTGAESRMAWQLHTLEREGDLVGAFVPSWFTARLWPEYYDSSKCQSL